MCPEEGTLKYVVTVNRVEAKRKTPALPEPLGYPRRKN